MSTVPQIGPVFAPTPSPSSRRTPALPQRLFFKELLGVRQFDSEHIALRLGYVYRSERIDPATGLPISYTVEAAALVETGGATFTGVYWLRSCSCPDHTKRRGAAAPHSIERVCKHMALLGELVGSWYGRRVQIPNLIVSRREMGGHEPVIWADGLSPLDRELGRRR